MNWKTIERPGHFGKRRDQKYREFNERFGEGNWRIAWRWGEGVIPYDLTCQIYEDGYYKDSFKREEVWNELLKTAREVYDLEPKDVESGLDYLVQKGIAIHLQDIAVRRVVLRRGWSFQGEELIQIRGHGDYWGYRFSPGTTPFHLPHLIETPRLKGWWDYNSIEDFYQSNKVLQLKE